MGSRRFTCQREALGGSLWVFTLFSLMICRSLSEWKSEWTSCRGIGRLSCYLWNFLKFGWKIFIGTSEKRIPRQFFLKCVKRVKKSPVISCIFFWIFLPGNCYEDAFLSLRFFSIFHQLRKGLGDGYLYTLCIGLFWFWSTYVFWFVYRPCRAELLLVFFFFFFFLLDPPWS